MQVSTVKFLKVKEEMGNLFRIDAEYWQSFFLKNNNLISGECKIRDYIENNVLNIKSSPIHRDFEYLDISNINLGNYQYRTNTINKGEEPDRATYILQKKDIVVSTVRPIRNAVAFITDDGVIGSSGLSVLRVKNIEPEYLAVFCRTNYFITCLMRANKATMYPAVSDSDILNTSIFIPSYELKKIIIELFNSAYEYNQISKKLYRQTETIMLSELGLIDYQSKHQLTFIKKHSDTKRAGRIDAEYYQPKYEDIIKAIKNYSGGWDTLENLCELIGHPSNPPYADSEYTNKTFIVTQKHLGNYCLTDDYWKSEDAKYTTDEFVYENKQFVLQKEDLVLYTVGGPPHIGKANLIFETDISSTIGSFVTLVRARQEQVNPYYLLALFNSFIGYQLTNKFMRGMVQQYIYPKDLAKTVIPILPKAKQTKIQEKITESFRLRQQSKHLLESAKKALDMAIEQDEQVAIKWLKNETREI